VVADESDLCITVSLWGANARNDTYALGQVLALRGARVSDYNGRSLNSGDEHSQMFIDCECARTTQLKKWWGQGDKLKRVFPSITGGLVNSIVNPVTSTVGSSKGDSTVSSTPPTDRDNFKLCEELINSVRDLNTSSTFTKFYKISGFVKTIFNDDKIMYLSCPDCRKKVIEEAGAWKCEHCSKTHSTNLPTYMLSALINDVSGSVMVQFPRELGDPIMGGKSATAFKQLKEELKEEPNKLKDFFTGCAF
jgi:replication factor A1